eukprot:6473828-Amphidinium_carterae.3
MSFGIQTLFYVRSRTIMKQQAAPSQRELAASPPTAQVTQRSLTANDISQYNHSNTPHIW